MTSQHAFAWMLVVVALALLAESARVAEGSRRHQHHCRECTRGIIAGLLMLVLGTALSAAGAIAIFLLPQPTPPINPPPAVITPLPAVRPETPANSR